MTASLHHPLVLLMQAMIAFAVWPIRGQQPRLPKLPAPPPMHIVTRTDRSELDTTRDPKARLRTTMSLADDHLKRAETLTEQKKYEAASSELGCYLGLMDDLRAFIASMNRDKSATRDLYRHFEISVRAHIPRIAIMRRTTPVDYATRLKDAEEYIKDAREEALDSFYGQTVLREKPAPEKTPSPEEPKEN